MPKLAVRPYALADRASVRAICFATGYMGSSADWYWRHAESFADIWTGYYTDLEPESLFVVADGDRVAGYLSGCVDSQRAPGPAQAIGRAALRHMLFIRPGTAGFFGRALFDTVRLGGAPDGELDDPRWPAHLHINLLPEARGGGMGRALMRAWIERLRGLGVPGCHLGTLHENQSGIGFFERQGFVLHGPPERAPGLRTPEGGPHHAQLMTLDL